MTIYLDMDGTFADLYGVPNWLAYIDNFDAYPYANAQPLCNMNSLAKAIHKAQGAGHRVGVISWLSKTATEEYNAQVDKAKRKWLKKHLKSVQFDEIHIIPYGTPKSTVATANSILIDDEARNRAEWGGKAYEPEKMFEIFKKLL